MVKRKLHRRRPGKDHKTLPASLHLLISSVMFVSILLCLFLASCTGSVQLARHIRMFRFLHCFWKLTRVYVQTSFWTLILLFIEVFVPSTYARFTSLCSQSTHPSPALALFTITTHTDVWPWVIHTLPPHPRALLLVLHFWVKLFIFHLFTRTWQNNARITYHYRYPYHD